MKKSYYKGIRDTGSAQANPASEEVLPAPRNLTIIIPTGNIVGHYLIQMPELCSDIKAEERAQNKPDKLPHPLLNFTCMPGTAAHRPA